MTRGREGVSKDGREGGKEERREGGRGGGRKEKVSKCD